MYIPSDLAQLGTEWRAINVYLRKKWPIDV